MHGVSGESRGELFAPSLNVSQLNSVLHLLSKRGRSIQADDDGALVAPPLRDLDPRIDGRKRNLHGASAGCGATTKEPLEAGKPGLQNDGIQG